MTAATEDAASRLYYLADVFRPWAIRAAATLHLADHITAGRRSVAELAEAVHADPDALYRLLRYLETQGLVVETPDGGRFGLTEVGAVLREDHPARLRSWLDQDGGMGRADAAASGILQAVREGEAVYDRYFGSPFWEDLEGHPDRRRAFDDLMGKQLDLPAPHIAAAYDWQDVGHVVDVGGGTGVLLSAILERVPNAVGTLVDLPRTAEQARHHFQIRQLSHRASAVGRSFFEPLPRGADVYILNLVLHDWPDSAAVSILRRCTEAASPVGRILVIDSIRSTRGNYMASTMDLYMLILFGGKERTMEEFDKLFRAAGLNDSRIVGAVGGRTLIECSRGER